MKKTATRFRLSLMTGILVSTPLCLSLAADTNSSNSDIAAPANAAAPVVSSAPAAVKLPYGVEDVLKLSRAQIGEEIILNYIQNSGTIYNLAPKDIVYLRDQGVSDKVINTMLDQRKRAEFAVQSAPASQAVPNAQSVPNAPGVADAASAPGAPYADQSATYAEAPLTPPASSAYVIPYSGAGYYYNYSPYYYPYYYGPAYYGWYGPTIGFGFRFGGHGGFHGGFHGGHGSFAGRGGHR
jgi:hypothetical protein